MESRHWGETRFYEAWRAKSTQAVAGLRRSDVKKRLVEIGDDVLDVFDADRQAHQALADADAFLHFLGHGGMGHEGGKGNERFDSPEAFRQGAELYLIEEAPGRFKAA